MVNIIPSREDFVEKFIDRYEARITNCYTEEWNRYVDMCKRFINESIVIKLKGLLIDHVEPVPYDLETRFNRKEQTEYSIWLFKSALLAANENKKLKIGDKITHNLPVSFKFYINENRYNRLVNAGLPLQFCIKDYNSIVELTQKHVEAECKKYGFGISIDTNVMETSEDQFKYFTIYLKQERQYNKSEDILIKGKSIETLTRYYNQQLDELKSSEGLPAILATAGVSFLLLCISGIWTYKEIKLIKLIQQYVSIKEMSMLNEYLAKFNKDIDKLQAKFKEGFYKCMPDQKCHHYEEPRLMIDLFKYANATTIIKNEYKRFDLNEGCYTTDALMKYDVNYDYYHQVTRDGEEYVYKYPNDTDEKIEAYIRKFIKSLSGKTLEASGTKIYNITNISSVYHNDNKFGIDMIMGFELPKVIKDLISDIVDRIKNSK
jgi:hypothetical protein